MTDDVFAESLKLPECIEILFNCLRNVERQLQDQQEQYSRRNCLLVHGIAEEKEEITDGVIIITLNEKLDLDITFRDFERTHRIGEPKKLEEKLVLLL